LVESVSIVTLRLEEEESTGVVGLRWLPRRSAAARSGDSRFAGRLLRLRTAVDKKRQIGEVRCRGEDEDSASWPRSSCVAVSIDLRKNVSSTAARSGDSRFSGRLLRQRTVVVKKRQIGEVRCRGEGKASSEEEGEELLAGHGDLQKTFIPRPVTSLSISRRPTRSIGVPASSRVPGCADAAQRFSP
jgi:hypothetical protein